MLLLALAVLVLLCSGCSGGGESARAAPVRVLLAAGDIVGCRSPGAAQTFNLLEEEPDAIVATLGDHVYQTGSPQQYRECYARTWGRVRARTRPTPGDHDYLTRKAAGFFGFFRPVLKRFGPTAARSAYYSYELGDWHVVVLNSNCSAVGGCGAGSPEGRWLRSDLARHKNRCTLAYWHQPLFNSGFEGDSGRVYYFWQALYKAGAELVLNGHNHAYERFEPQAPDGTPDERGIREIVVGTGGRSHYPFAKGTLQPNSEVRNDSTFGVLKLTLKPDGYAWRFLSAGGGTFADAGDTSCH